ncbi:MAG: hypothetical protein IJ757_04195 [Clostridiales bacterium]|nr:hypothetical protein [Clostridiales bacterium]
MSSDGKPVSIDKKLRYTIFGFIALLAVAIVLLVLVSRNEEESRGADSYIHLSGQSGFACEYAEAQKLYAFGDGVLKVTKERVAYLTLSGNEVFSTSVSYNNPQCFIDNDNCVVFDSDGYGFVVMNTNKVLYEKPTENKIQSATLSDNGLCAVITASSDAYGEVILYNTDGSLISRWSSYNSGYPICAAFSGDERYFALTTLNTTGAVYKPYVRIFSLDYNNDSISASDYAVFTIDDTEILSYTDYIGDRLYTFCADRIYTITNDALVPLVDSFGAINYVRIVDDVIFVVYSDGVNQLNKLMILGTGGDIIYDSEVGSDVNAIASNNDLYALSIDDRILIYNSNGNVVSDISVDEDIIRIGFTDNNRLVVVSTGGVHTVDY